jgi:hypothetical protein
MRPTPAIFPNHERMITSQMKISENQLIKRIKSMQIRMAVAIDTQIAVLDWYTLFRPSPILVFKS